MRHHQHVAWEHRHETGYWGSLWRADEVRCGWGFSFHNCVEIDLLLSVMKCLRKTHFLSQHQKGIAAPNRPVSHRRYPRTEELLEKRRRSEAVRPRELCAIPQSEKNKKKKTHPLTSSLLELSTACRSLHPWIEFAEFAENGANSFLTMKTVAALGRQNHRACGHPPQHLFCLSLKCD